MPKANPKKIRSAPKAKLFTILAVGVVVFAVFWWLMIIIGLFGLGDDKPEADYLLQTANQTYQLESATTAAEREKGLSGRSSLPLHHGMLFIFPDDERQCFWMKETLIPLDIIWADADKKVTHVQPGVLPSSYPESFCAEGKYVIELNAAQARSAGIKAGQRLEF